MPTKTTLAQATPTQTKFVRKEILLLIGFNFFTGFSPHFLIQNTLSLTELSITKNLNLAEIKFIRQ